MVKIIDLISHLTGNILRINKSHRADLEDLNVYI